MKRLTDWLKHKWTTALRTVFGGVSAIIQGFKNMTTSTKWGAALTVVWLLGVLYIVCYSFEFKESSQVIELANFVAYSCSIPALVWLIVGYYRQGQDLRNQEENFREQLGELKKQNNLLGQHRRVLRAQTRELKAQAQHTESLAESAKKERRRIEDRENRQAEPILVAESDRVDNQQVTTTFINRGGAMRNIRFTPGQGDRLAWSPGEHLEANASAQLTLFAENNGAMNYPIRFRITCRDGVGNHHILDFERTEGNRPWRPVRPE